MNLIYFVAGYISATIFINIAFALVENAYYNDKKKFMKTIKLIAAILCIIIPIASFWSGIALFILENTWMGIACIITCLTVVFITKNFVIITIGKDMQERAERERDGYRN